MSFKSGSTCPNLNHGYSTPQFVEYKIYSLEADFDTLISFPVPICDKGMVEVVTLPDVGFISGPHIFCVDEMEEVIVMRRHTLCQM